MPNKTFRFGEYIESNVGVLQAEFLSAPVSVMGPPEARVVTSGTSVRDVMRELKAERKGCVLICDTNEKLLGIFTERDYVLKVFEIEGAKDRPVDDFMTLEPTTIEPHASVGFCLTLMSAGGFRHLPVLSEDGEVLGMISVKILVDFLSQRLMQDIDHLVDEED